ncbi:hypothetical protein C1646_758225 [Rhizophagus diaphanus]|nr:hypothetical protein C1646_758225 [Rhizophagus diaphanus] [Rhizophagus sp. MUCL 43196]
MSHEERNTSCGRSMGNKERNKSRSSSTSHEERNKSHGRLMTTVPKLTTAAKVLEVQKETIGDTTGAIGNQKEMLFSIRSTLNYLVEEVHILKMKQSYNNTTINRDESVSPEPTVQSQHKDEIVQILAGFDDSLSLDYTKSWNEIYKHVSKNIMPAVDKAQNSRIQYKPTELKYILQQLHCHRRKNWQISQDDEKSKKKERQKRGFLHMYNTNDPVFLYSQPSSLSDKKYKKDIEELATNEAYHSDEMLETDEEKAQKEIAKNVQPKNKDKSDKHVIRVYDKPWRSRKVNRKDQLGESVQNIKVQRKRWYNDNDYQDRSTPPDGAPEWTISSSYILDTDERNGEKGEEEIAQLSTHDKYVTNRCHFGWVLDLLKHHFGLAYIRALNRRLGYRFKILGYWIVPKLQNIHPRHEILVISSLDLWTCKVLTLDYTINRVLDRILDKILDRILQ